MKAIKSGKQSRAEIKAARVKRRARRHCKPVETSRYPRPLGAVWVSADRLRSNNSYSVPLFVERGYYEDQPFCCVDCGAAGVWTAEQQRWWYEVAQGDVFTRARRCAPCRAKERERKASARRLWQEGLARKAARLASMAAKV